jgi:hypothetical protein
MSLQCEGHSVGCVSAAAGWKCLEGTKPWQQHSDTAAAAAGDAAADYN